LIDKTEYINKAKAKYNSYGSEWLCDYFNYDNGGYLVISKQRIEQGKLNKQEQKKYNKEYDMCLTLAQNGYQIEYLKITEGSFDIFLNEIAADLKKTSRSKNIAKYAKKALREQGAEKVVFEFEEDLKEIHTHLFKLSEYYGIHGYFFFSNHKNKIQSF